MVYSPYLVDGEEEFDATPEVDLDNWFKRRKGQIQIGISCRYYELQKEGYKWNFKGSDKKFMWMVTKKVTKKVIES